MESPDPILAPTESPPLTEDDAACFNAWFEHHRSLPEIATSLKICVDELAEWAAQPHIRQRLDAVIAAAKLRQECLAVEASHGSLFRLSQLALYSKNEEVACRAATRILLSQLRPIRTRVVPAPLTPPPRGRGLGGGFDERPSAVTTPAAATECIASDNPSAPAPPDPLQPVPETLTGSDDAIADSLPLIHPLGEPLTPFPLTLPTKHRRRHLTAQALNTQAGTPNTLAHALSGAQHGP